MRCIVCGYDLSLATQVEVLTKQTCAMCLNSTIPRVDASPPAVLLAEYWDRLQAHDWYFDKTDDHRVWKAGHANYSELVRLAGLSVEHYDLFAAFSIHHQGGGKSPLPGRPKE